MKLLLPMIASLLLFSSNSHANFTPTIQSFFSQLSIAAGDHPTLIHFEYLDSRALTLRRNGASLASCEHVSTGGVSGWLQMIASGLMENGCVGDCQAILHSFEVFLGADDFSRCLYREVDAYATREVIEYRSHKGVALFGFELVLSQ
jgi:hypothetical protein